MTRRGFTVVVVLLAAGGMLSAQQVVDRMVARIENDVILLSSVRELARYQQLTEGKSESDGQLLDRLIDQWVVRTEAEASRFPHPSNEDIERGGTNLEKSFASTAEYEARKKQSGLSDTKVRGMVAAQLYLTNYLDSRFRPSVPVDSKAIEDFYKTGVVPLAKSRGQEPPTLEVAHDYIQEALVQRGITEQADRWLKESRARLHVEKMLVEGAK